jgi:hypothetical protein
MLATNMTTIRAGIVPLVVAKERRRKCALCRSSPGGSFDHAAASQMT